MRVRQHSRRPETCLRYQVHSTLPRKSGFDADHLHLHRHHHHHHYMYLTCAELARQLFIRITSQIKSSSKEIIIRGRAVSLPYVTVN